MAPELRREMRCQGNLLFQPQLHWCALQWHPLWGLLSQGLADDAKWRLAAGSVKVITGGASPDRMISPKHRQGVVWKRTLPGALSLSGYLLGILFLRLLSDFSSKLWEHRVHLKSSPHASCLGLWHQMTHLILPTAGGCGGRVHKPS